MNNNKGEENNPSADALKQSAKTAKHFQKSYYKKQYQKNIIKKFKSKKNNAIKRKVLNSTVGKKSKYKLLIVFVLLLLFAWAFNLIYTLTVVGGIGVGIVATATYGTENEDIYAVVDYYTALENDLKEYLEAVETEYPGYDEYVYDVQSIECDKTQLISYLWIKHPNFTFEEVQHELDMLFEEQYILKIEETTPSKLHITLQYEDFQTLLDEQNGGE